MSRILQPPPKFTHPEWVISNQTKYASAEGERSAAERLVMEAERIIHDTDKTTFKVQRDVNKKFGTRLWFDLFIVKFIGLIFYCLIYIYSLSCIILTFTQLHLFVASKVT